MPFLRRILSVFLSISLLFSSVSYAGVNVSDILNGTSVSTDFGTWDSPRTGTRYFYGGSYTFAFKGSGRYQPFFQGEAPSFKIGCGGFSLSAGFVALLGLDEIKVLLKNAGATLAWGVMTAFKLSMPGLASVFETLRKFAREIQKLLNNACHLGNILATKTKTGQAITGRIQEAIDGSVGEVDKLFKNFNDGISGMAKTVEDWNEGIDNDCLSFTGDALKKCKNKIANTASESSNKLKLSSPSVFTSLVGKYAENSSVKNKFYLSTLKQFLDTGKIGSLQIITNTDTLQEIKTSILLTRLFFGDYVVSTAEGSGFKKLTDNLKSFSFTSGDYEITNEKINEKEMAKYTNRVKDSMVMRTRKEAIISSPELVAKGLLYGLNEGSNQKYCTQGECKVSNNYVFYLSFAEDSDAKNTIVALGSTEEESNSDSLTVEWNGAYKESLQKIRSIVRDKTGYEPIYTALNEDSVSVSNNSKVPLLLPNINKYLETIVLLEKKEQGETPFTANLKSILALNNGMFYSKSLVDLIIGLTLDAINSKGSTFDIKDLEKYIEELYEKRKAILDKIQEERDNQITYIDLAEMFDKIDKNIRKENMKGY